MNKKGIMDERERDLQLSYGLGYPEPNVVFALCRGSRSSPAVRTILNRFIGRSKQSFLNKIFSLFRIQIKNSCVFGFAAESVHGGGHLERAGASQGGVPGVVGARGEQEEGGRPQAAALAHAGLRRRRRVAARVDLQPAPRPVVVDGAAQAHHQGAPRRRRRRRQGGGGEGGGGGALQRRIPLPAATLMR